MNKQELKYRLGKRQKRAIIEIETGKEHLIFPIGSEEAAQEYCDYLNSKILLPFVPPVNQNMVQMMNELLNDAMCKPGYISNPDSNKIAEFINKWFEGKSFAPVNKEVTEKQLQTLASEYLREIDEKDGLSWTTGSLKIMDKFTGFYNRVNSQLLSPTPSIEGEEAVKVFTHLELPEKSKEDPTLSVDVIIKLEDMLNIGFFDSKEGLWVFHTDTLVEPNGKPFTWIYAPKF